MPLTISATTFSRGVAALGHADAYVVPLQFLHIDLAAILASTVGVVYQHGRSFIVYRGQCHLQCLQWIDSLERRSDSPTSYHVRVGKRILETAKQEVERMILSVNQASNNQNKKDNDSK